MKAGRARSIVVAVVASAAAALLIAHVTWLCSYKSDYVILQTSYSSFDPVVLSQRRPTVVTIDAPVSAGTEPEVAAEISSGSYWMASPQTSLSGGAASNVLVVNRSKYMWLFDTGAGAGGEGGGGEPTKVRIVSPAAAEGQWEFAETGIAGMHAAHGVDMQRVDYVEVVLRPRTLLMLPRGWMVVATDGVGVVCMFDSVSYMMDRASRFLRTS